MTGRERSAYLFLSLLQAKTGSSIMSRIGDLSPANVMEMTAKELSKHINMTERAMRIFTGLKKEFDASSTEERLTRRNISFVTPADAGYPERLCRIPDLPPALYLQGHIPEAPAVALVGSRKASPTGLEVARRLAEALSERGVCVISGLALGVDAAAHQGSLAGGGPTVGVLGCGIDLVYPKTNRGLFERVRQSGSIVSEYYLGEPPLPWRFPARNRIIAGLADALVVVEAAEKSGALITARHALESGRDVWAVPGPLGATECRGSNKLLSDGAGVLWDIPEFVEEIAPKTHADSQSTGETSELGTQIPDELPGDEARVLAGIGFEPTPVDAVARQSGLEMRELLSTLSLLELKGFVTRDTAGSLMRRPIG